MEGARMQSSKENAIPMLAWCPVMCLLGGDCGLAGRIYTQGEWVIYRSNFIRTVEDKGRLVCDDDGNWFRLRGGMTSHTYDELAELDDTLPPVTFNWEMINEFSEGLPENFRMWIQRVAYENPPPVANDRSADVRNSRSAPEVWEEPPTLNRRPVAFSSISDREEEEEEEENVSESFPGLDPDEDPALYVDRVLPRESACRLLSREEYLQRVTNHQRRQRSRLRRPASVSPPSSSSPPARRSRRQLADDSPPAKRKLRAAVGGPVLDKGPGMVVLTRLGERPGGQKATGQRGHGRPRVPGGQPRSVKPLRKSPPTEAAMEAAAGPVQGAGTASADTASARLTGAELVTRRSRLERWAGPVSRAERKENRTRVSSEERQVADSLSRDVIIQCSPSSSVQTPRGTDRFCLRTFTGQTVDIRNLARSRSGRLIKPILDEWRGQRINVVDGEVVEIYHGKEDRVYTLSPTAKSKPRRRTSRIRSAIPRPKPQLRGHRRPLPAKEPQRLRRRRDIVSGRQSVARRGITFRSPAKLSEDD